MNDIERLEARIAFFEDMNEKLSMEIYSQAQKIQMLEGKVAKLAEKVNFLSEDQKSEIPNQRPPHY
ncbi:MAG: SlyX family protein [Spirochaetales bacterium]|nr:SlyX family protein [Spirochaetales bacterium]